MCPTSLTAGRSRRCTTYATRSSPRGTATATTTCGTSTEVLDRIDELDRAGERFDRVPVVLAAWFHDAVYDALPDAEERSAQWAERALPEPPAAEVARLVRMTEHHRPFPDDRNACVLSDADLAILAAAGGALRGVHGRASGGSTPASATRTSRAGRAAVLRDLLDGPRLFATDAGARLWEETARANATAEIERLRPA